MWSVWSLQLESSQTYVHVSMTLAENHAPCKIAQSALFILLRANGEIIVSWPEGSEVANTLGFLRCIMQKRTDRAGLPWRYSSSIKRTLTSLSQPLETMTGFWGLGLKRTQETHSV